MTDPWFANLGPVPPETAQEVRAWTADRVRRATLREVIRDVTPDEWADVLMEIYGRARAEEYGLRIAKAVYAKGK